MKPCSRLARSLGLQAILCAVLALAGIFEAGCPVLANAWPTVVIDRMEHPSMPLGCGCADWSCPLPDYCHDYDGSVRLRVYGDKVVKGNLKVDWTEPHRDDVRAAVRAAVKRVLYRRGIRQEDFDRMLGSVLVQAEAMYADWPLTAFMEIESTEQ